MFACIPIPTQVTILILSVHVQCGYHFMLKVEQYIYYILPFVLHVYIKILKFVVFHTCPKLLTLHVCCVMYIIYRKYWEVSASH